MNTITATSTSTSTSTTVEGQNSGTPFLPIIPEGARARVRTKTRVRVRARTKNGGSAARCSYKWSWPWPWPWSWSWPWPWRLPEWLVRRVSLNFVPQPYYYSRLLIDPSTLILKLPVPGPEFFNFGLSNSQNRRFHEIRGEISSKTVLLRGRGLFSVTFSWPFLLFTYHGWFAKLPEGLISNPE